ncbi:MAG: helicase-related protein, partial [Nannocystaceae bacterium]
MSTVPLPIDDVMADVLAALEQARAVVIEAPPGAGKTTRVPLALLEAGLADDGEIVVLQPRRIAARMSARRVAALLGEPVGQRCGYQVRFESKVSSRTKIRFLTEGLLIARLLDDPQLRGVTTVILDEFHERHLDTDLALMALRRLQQTTRPDLRVLIMSATMDGQHVCTYFEPDPCPRIRSLGRMYPVTLVHTATARDRNLKLHNLVLRAFHNLVDPPAPEQPIAGHVLVFLPGAREIRDCAEACAGLAAHHGFEIHRLHGELPPADQDRAVEHTQTKKLILSTNVAETSITIDGVVAVIDSGLHRQASHDPWSGLPNLELRPISRASAAQRAGRAGRTQAGACIRLYSQHDHDHRPAYDRPEILRADLTAAILTLACLDTGAAPGLSKWLDAPAPAALDHATGLLRQLGALDEDAGVTPEGRLLRRLPVHPRLAKVLVLGARSGITSCAAGAVALLSERSIYTAAARRRPANREVACDLRRELDDLELNRRASGASGLVPEACARVKRVRRQLEKLVRTRILPSLNNPKRSHREGRDDPDTLDAALCFALLAAYPDRVAEVRRDDRGDRTVAFCQGGHAHLGKRSGIGTSRLVVALSIESRREGGLGHSWVSRAAAIEAEWLLDLVPDAISDHNTLTFDNKRERVEGYGELRYGNVTLDRSRLTTL